MSSSADTNNVALRSSKPEVFNLADRPTDDFQEIPGCEIKMFDLSKRLSLLLTPQRHRRVDTILGGGGDSGEEREVTFLSAIFRYASGWIGGDQGLI